MRYDMKKYGSSRTSRLWLSLLAASACAACNTTSFKSDTPKHADDAKPADPEKPRNSSGQMLKLACENGVGEAHLVTELAGPKTTTVRLEGEFCGVKGDVAAGNLTVLFVLDFSGSMEANDPSDGTSCGRLKAGSAIVNKLKTAAAASAGGAGAISLGILNFGDGATQAVNIQPLTGFDPQLTATNFCGSSGGSTNYEAAFAETQAMLAGISGPKAVYFISDGMPTKAGVNGTFPPISSIITADPLQGVHEAGLKAAEALRAGIPDLTLNAIYLGNAEALDPTMPTLGLPDPETYLGQITGDPQKVRVVSSAEDLAAQIVTLDTPELGKLDESSVAATVSSASLGQRAIPIASLTKDPTREGVWTFQTDAFELYAQDRQAIKNDIVLTVKGSDGKEYRATAVITFTADDSVGGTGPTTGTAVGAGTGSGSGSSSSTDSGTLISTP